MSALLEKLSTLKIIPVIAIKNADDAVALGHALMDNGMPSAEITFRTPAAADAIRQMRAAFPDMIARRTGVVAAIEPDGVRLDDGESITARLVVAADSRFSEARRRAGIGGSEGGAGCRAQDGKPERARHSCRDER